MYFRTSHMFMESTRQPQLKSHVFSKFHPFCLEIHPHPVSAPSWKSHVGAPSFWKSSPQRRSRTRSCGSWWSVAEMSRWMGWPYQCQKSPMVLREKGWKTHEKPMKNPWKSDEITGIARVVSKFRSPSHRVPAWGEAPGRWSIWEEAT